MEQTTTRVAAASTGLAGRYAAALFDLADKSDALEGVAADLQTLDKALAEAGAFRALTENPAIRRTEALAAVGALAKTLGLSGLTARFLGVLAENRRLAALPAIIGQFTTLRNASSGTRPAVVTSAQALTAAQRRSLQTSLEARTGRSIALETKVDPSLLGGLVVRLGSEQIDSSVKTRLMRLGQQMKG